MVDLVHKLQAFHMEEKAQQASHALEMIQWHVVDYELFTDRRNHKPPNYLYTTL